MLNVFSINVYAFLDPSATLLFVTPLVAQNFDILVDILHEPFIVSTQVTGYVVAKKVYRNCPIMLPNRVLMLTQYNLIRLILMLFWVWIGFMLAFALYIVEQGW